MAAIGIDSRQTNAHFGTANCYTVAPYAGAPLCSAGRQSGGGDRNQPGFSVHRYAAQPDICPA